MPWKKVGEISLGKTIDAGKGSNVFRSRKGFGFDTEREFKARPSNIAIRDLLGDDRLQKWYILEFLIEPKLVMLRKGS